MDNKKLIILGSIGAVYGIKGWLKINSFTQNPTDLFDYKPWLIEKNGKIIEINIEDWKHHNKSLVAKIKGLDVREEAQLYTGFDILIKSSDLPKLKDEYYWRDLIGMEVINSSGYNLGKITDLMETGSNDVLVVKANLKDAFNKKERLIPFIESQIVSNVDLKQKIITVDWDPNF